MEPERKKLKFKYSIQEQFKIFHTLDKAITISKERQFSSLAVFAQEFESCGKRRFLVGPRKYFWEVYKNLNTKKYYEIIRKKPQIIINQCNMLSVLPIRSKIDIIRRKKYV